MSNHFISLEKAVQMTTFYRETKDKVIKEEYQDKNILSICETFDRAAFDKVLGQAGCTGLRVYYGMDDISRIHAIIVGVNERGEDLLPALGTQDSMLDDNSEPIIEEAQLCPPNCPPASPLNP